MVLLENLDLPTVEIPAPVFSAQIRCFAHTLETFGQYGLETDHESLAPARLDQIHQLTVLGHIQRGGTPSAYDRVTASKLGFAAVEALMDDQKSVMVGYHNNEIDQVPFRKVIKLKKKVDPNYLQMVEILSI